MNAGSGALRRRRKRSLLTRLRVGWIFIFTIVGALGFAAYTLVTLPALRAHDIVVRIDGPAVNERAVLRAANIDRGTNVWLLNTAAIAERIEAIPYVDTAAVRRSLPALLTIAVSLREPAACVTGADRVVTIDAGRRILQLGCARPSALQITLPTARFGAAGTVADSAGLASLLADGAALRGADLGIRQIRQDAFGQLVAIDGRGISLLLGSDADLAEKAKLVAPVLAAAGPGRPIRAIDLRAPATPTIQFK